jgi:hypothetical protein
MSTKKTVQHPSLNIGEKPMPNALTPAFASYDQEGTYRPGMTKAEYATIAYTAAFIHAHGRSPDRNQLAQFAELATVSLNGWMLPADTYNEGNKEEEGQ